jgi:hypothetical protein
MARSKGQGAGDYAQLLQDTVVRMGREGCGKYDLDCPYRNYYCVRERT